MKKHKKLVPYVRPEDHIEIYIADNGTVEFHNISRHTLELIRRICAKDPGAGAAFCG